ncbi:hypothetical protein CBS147332_4071 [Penicillium roqueforti]|nr:hypothetical protein CBS147332_4071 [Penicillium roqueforti]KAI3108932.1 hypothetical protein CBS147331_5724 [Penicillium roqueforti]KAI3234169.1 hypothetical protein CBS147310_4646 [Penicillium roqueforti]KAI3260209.1 hypothetical protein DTO012A9_3077 [Penicillium roqueforti]
MSHSLCFIHWSLYLFYHTAFCERIMGFSNRKTIAGMISGSSSAEPQECQQGPSIYHTAITIDGLIGISRDGKPALNADMVQSVDPSTQDGIAVVK